MQTAIELELIIVVNNARSANGRPNDSGSFYPRPNRGRAAQIPIKHNEAFSMELPCP